MSMFPAVRMSTRLLRVSIAQVVPVMAVVVPMVTVPMAAARVTIKWS